MRLYVLEEAEEADSASSYSVSPARSICGGLSESGSSCYWFKALSPTFWGKFKMQSLLSNIFHFCSKNSEYFIMYLLINTNTFIFVCSCKYRYSYRKTNPHWKGNHLGIRLSGQGKVVGVVGVGGPCNFQGLSIMEM